MGVQEKIKRGKENRRNKIRGVARSDHERRKKEKENRRDKIIRVARREFLKSGLKKASIMKIAKEAGLSHRTIYNFFRTKQELYAAVLVYGQEILCRELEEISTKEANPVKGIKLVKDIFQEFFGKQREFFRIMMLMGFHELHREVNKKMCDDVSSGPLRCVKAISKIVEKGKKKGVFDVDNSWDLSWLLWSIFVGIGHLNEARHSLNIKKNDFEKLQNLAYNIIFKSQV